MEEPIYFRSRWQHNISVITEINVFIMYAVTFTAPIILGKSNSVKESWRIKNLVI